MAFWLCASAFAQSPYAACISITNACASGLSFPWYWYWYGSTTGVSHPSAVKCASVPGASVTVGVGALGGVYVTVVVTTGGRMHPPGPVATGAVALGRVEPVTVAVAGAVRLRTEVGQYVGAGGVETVLDAAAGSVMTLVMVDFPLTMMVVDRTGGGVETEGVLGGITVCVAVPFAGAEMWVEDEDAGALEWELLDEDEDVANRFALDAGTEATLVAFDAGTVVTPVAFDADAEEAPVVWALDTPGELLNALLDEDELLGAPLGAGTPRANRDLSAYGMYVVTLLKSARR